MVGGIFFGNVPVGVNEVKEGPFVRVEVIVIFLEGGKVVEVVLKVMVEMESVAVVVVVFGGRAYLGLGFFRAHFFCGPSTTVSSPLQIGGGLHFFCLVCRFFLFHLFGCW